MRRNTGWKVTLGIIETLSAIALLFAVIFGVPVINDWLSTHLSIIGILFTDYGNWIGGMGLPTVFATYTQFWGMIMAIAVLLVLQLLTVAPLIILTRKAKTPGDAAAVKPFETTENSYVVPFVDRKGNFGHALVKGKPIDITDKYFAGLNDVQAGQEFDWHNYVGGRPIGRIITGIVLGLAGILFVAFRVGWFFARSTTGYMGGIYDNQWTNTFQNALNSVQNYLFQPFSSTPLWTSGSVVLTAADVLDAIFWLACAFAAVMALLLLVSLLVWLFRKPAAEKRAAAARQKYLDALVGKQFNPSFSFDARFAIVGVRPQKILTGESSVDKESPIDTAAISTTEGADAVSDISQIGTGIAEIDPVRLNVEGNVIRRSAAEYSIGGLEDDILLLDPTLLSSIGVLERVQDNSAKALPVNFLGEDILPRQPLGEPAVEAAPLGARAVAAAERPVVELKPLASDEKPADWYGAALGESGERPSSILPAAWYEGAGKASVSGLSRASDEKPDFWYGGAQNVTAAQNLNPADETPDHWYAVSEKTADARPSGFIPDTWFGRESKIPSGLGNGVQVKEDDLDRAIAEAIEPSALSPLPTQGGSISAADAAALGTSAVVEENTAPVAAAPVYLHRPSDKTPDFWYVRAESGAQGTRKTLAAPNKVLRPSDEKPENWYGESQAAVVRAEEDGLYNQIQNAIEPFRLTPAPEAGTAVDHKPGSIVTPAGRIPEYWYGNAGVEAGESQTARPKPQPIVPTAASPSVWPVSQPSDKVPPFWYYSALEEMSAPDEAATAKAVPVAEPVVASTPLHPEAAHPVTPISPIVPITPVAPMKHEEETPIPAEESNSVRGPVALQHELSHAAPVAIKPVEARVVRFQLKTVAGGYSGTLSPAEAFAKAVTNQTVVINPVYSDQARTQTRYLSRQKKKAADETLKSGYLSATVVSNLTDREKRGDTFDQPVSAFPSIREWKKAKKAWTETRKAEDAKPWKSEGRVVPVRPVAPIARPVAPVAPTPAASVKPALVKPLNPVLPVQPLKPIEPIKPIEPTRPVKPIDSGKKGE